jgi:hypothetical protein
MVRRFSSVPIARLIVGLAQGIVLYALYTALESAVWPATDGYFFAPLLLVFLLVPPTVLTAAGNMRVRTLFLWTIATSVILAALGFYDVWRGGETSGSWFLFASNLQQAQLFPSSRLIFEAVLGMFIAHSLLIASDAEHRLVAPYPRYFDAAWKLEVQLLLSLAFIAAFWLLLYLGAALFELVKLDFLMRLYRHRWFSIPATTLAFAGAIHVTDVRSGLTRGIQTVTHVLLSWLLPLLALIIVGFLATLPFTGLDPLWSTRHAAGLLLTVAAALVVLVNATYQDGQADRATPRLLRYAASLAVIALTPVVVLAGYALFLRIGQYGWTASRIVTAASVAAAAGYALGYLWAVVAPGPWLKRIETSNVVLSVVVLCLIIALASPIADPARLSVADQLARLRSGKVSAETFDFAYLRFQGARYGRAALESMKSGAAGESSTLIKDKAEAALRLQSPWQRLGSVPKAQDLIANIAVYPDGRSLPDSFTQQDWGANQTTRWLLPQCLTDKSVKCEALLVDIDVDGVDDIVLVEKNRRSAVFKSVQDGTWTLIGTLPPLAACAGTLGDAMRAGRVKIVPPAWRDVDIDGRRFRLDTSTVAAADRCP